MPAFQGYYPATEAASRIGISYINLMKRTKRKDSPLFIPSEKVGRSVFIHKDEVAKARRKEKARKRQRELALKGDNHTR